MIRSASVKRRPPQLQRRLRRQATDAEKKFWKAVRNRQVSGAKFRRQWPIGGFVAVFCCAELKLVVEIDGGQHANDMKDDERTLELGKLGYRVVRFWNNDVLTNLEGVIHTLTTEIGTDPSPAR